MINGLGVISTIVLARLLVPEDFGLVAIASAIVAIATSLTEMSLSQALIHRRDIEDDHLHTAWTLGVARSTLLGLIIAAVATPIAMIYGDPRLTGVMYVLAVNVFISGFTNPRQALLTKQLIFWQEVMMTVSQRLVALVVAILIAWIWHSYWALILGVLAGQAISVVLSYTLYPYRPRFRVRHARDLFSFSVWLTLAQGVETLNQRFDQLLVGHFFGTKLLGLYTVGEKLSQLPTREGTAPLMKTMFPAFSMIKGDAPRLKRAYRRAQRLLVLAALPIGVGFALVSAQVVIVAMGEEWRSAIPLIQGLSVVFALQSLGSMVRPLAMSQGHTRVLFLRDSAMFFFRVAVILIGIFSGGFVGLIVARLVIGLVMTLVNMHLVRKLSGLTLREQFGGNLNSLASAALMSVATLAFQHAVGPQDGVLHQLALIAGSLALMLTVYAISNFVLWRLSGSPEGPEREFASLLKKLTSRLTALGRT